MPRQFPKLHHPTPPPRRGKRPARRQGHILFIRVPCETSPVGQAGHGDDRDGHAVVGTEAAEVAVEEGGAGDEGEEVGDDEGEDGEAVRREALAG